MNLYDRKDLEILAQTFESVAPDSIRQRAELLVALAAAVFVTNKDLQAAIDKLGNLSLGLEWKAL